MQAKSFFESQVDRTKKTLKSLKSTSFVVSMSRLLLFLIAGLILWFFGSNTSVVAITIFVALAGFLLLVSKYTDLKSKIKFQQSLLDLNLKELNAFEEGYEDFDSGWEYLDSAHPFNQDIDLYGEGSLFQLINRTGTISGRNALAEILNANDNANVVEKQEAIKELATFPEWRQRFQVTASMIENEVDANAVLHWMHNHKRSIPKVFKWLPIVFSVGSLGVIVLYGLGYFGFLSFLTYYLIGAAITFAFIGKINELYERAGLMKETLSQFSTLIWAVENKAFDSSLLQNLKSKLERDGLSASDVLKKLSKDISSLDQRNNLLFAFFSNGLLLWDLRFSYRIEEWIDTNDEQIDQWFEAIAAFDAYNSFGNFTFIKEGYEFPVLSEDNKLIEAKGLGHPLLHEESRVDNDIAIRAGDFFIITGANMAGKSTFLRSIALSMVMANCGLPVCAQSMSYRPVKLISSMRTTDSLKDDESYFYSELKRLKYIIDTIATQEHFIILDEILKGTNSKDKAEGSAQFLERLLKTGSSGLIATHDLSLTKLGDAYEQVQNHYFDAQILEDELYFDYTFKEGVCQNMNASFLLRKMGIVE